jgi:hypothetical protein
MLTQILNVVRLYTWMKLKYLVLPLWFPIGVADSAYYVT